MAITWNSLFEDYPDGSESPSQIDELIQTTREAVGERLRHEHTGDLSSGLVSEDGWHRNGSAVVYNQESVPTTKPDLTTALDENDNGRIWRQPSTGQLAYYQHDAGATANDRWQKQLATSSEFTAAESITTGDIVSLDASGEAQVADASATTKSFAVGVALQTVSAGQSVIVQKSGLKSGFTGLTAGTAYFLNDSGEPVGVGSVEDNWVRVPIGVAVSSTVMDLNISFPQFSQYEVSMIGSKHVGEIFYTSVPFELPGCKWLDYSELSQTLYAELFGKFGHLFAKDATDAAAAESAGTFHLPDGSTLNFARGARTYTITDSSITMATNRITVTHGLTVGTDDGRAVKLVRRPGESPTYPTGPTEYDQYCLRIIDASTVELYDTEAHAVDTSGTTGIVNFTAAGSGTFYLSTMGCYQADQMQGHWHEVRSDINNYYADPLGTSASGSNTYQINAAATGDELIAKSPTTDGTNGTPRTGAETRPSYVSLGMQIKVAGTATTGETYDTLKYDTGWLSTSGWTTGATINIPHNLNAPYTDLTYTVMVRDPAVPTKHYNADFSIYNGNTGSQFGQIINGVAGDNNNIAVQLGNAATTPGRYMNDSGSGTIVPLTWEYKVVVYKPDLFTKTSELIGYVGNKYVGEIFPLQFYREISSGFPALMLDGTTKTIGLADYPDYHPLLWEEKVRVGSTVAFSATVSGTNVTFADNADNAELLAALDEDQEFEGSACRSITIAGAEYDIVSIDTSTRVVVVGSAPGDGAVSVYVYPYRRAGSSSCHVREADGLVIANGGASGTIAGLRTRDQMQQITGQAWAGVKIDTVGDGAFAGGFVTGTPAGWASGGNGSSNRWNFDSANSPNARTGTTTRERRLGAYLYVHVGRYQG